MKRKKPSKKIKSIKIVESKTIRPVKQLVQILIFVILLVTVVFFAKKILNPPQLVEIYEEVTYYDNLTQYIVGPPGSTHHHSTFLIYINGQLKRFDDAGYFQASPYAHIHDYSFAEIHTHAVNVTLGFFFNTIGITFDATCLVFGVNESYCTNSTHSLKFYVEGKPNPEFGRKLTVDWQHYLITYGTESDEDLEKQIRNVPDPLASPPPPGRIDSIFSPNYESL